MTCSTTTPPALESSYGTWRRRYEDDLFHPLFPLLEVERAIVERRWKPEPIRDQHFLAGSIAVIHPADLRHGLVALVDDDDGIVGQVVEQRRRRGAGWTAGQVARVVLDAVAVPDLADHLQVEHRPLVQPLRLEQLAFGFEARASVRRAPRLIDSTASLVRSREVTKCDFGYTATLSSRRMTFPVSGSNQASSSTSSPNSPMRRACSSYDGHDLDDVAADAEGAAAELHVVAFVLDLDQLAQDLIAVDALTEFEREQQAVVRLGRAEAVDARDAGDDDDVASLEERPRRRQPHPIDLVVDGRFLLDVRVGRGHVGFGLVVVVVADEVLDGVLGEEALELLIELRGQRLVVRHHQRRPVHLREHLRHGERLARSGDSRAAPGVNRRGSGLRRARAPRGPGRRGLRSR